MELIYPPGPEAVPETLTRPTAAYQQRAWLAMGGLGLFVLLYFFLSGWFIWTCYKLTFGGAMVGSDGFWSLVVAACAAFLAVFMLKALFFVKHGGKSDDIEITIAEQPRLFAFLHRLADEAGAPRPHRVFLSPRVNAAVFYDLSIVNLIFPSKKNLEIGLALVNVLSLGELKAVLAHEFGHFAQRSMAVGRWVYIAQQIAAHVIAKRDMLDDFLRGLSRFDFRVAWVGWILSLIVWSIRSLLETAFNLVVLAQRALSREMEMQADLVAVSLTGSDALIHALHRIAGADDAWDRAIGFANGELGKGRLVADLFAVQSHIIAHMRTILGQPDYGAEPAAPAERPELHRVFKTELAQPPRMWSSHPFNHEREDNAKRVYIAAPLDQRSAWDAFDDAGGLRARMTGHLMPKPDQQNPPQPTPIEESLKTLDQQFGIEFLKRSYRGVYLGRSVVRQARQAAELYDAALEGGLAALESLYPESLAEDLEKLRNLEKEKSLLESLRDGTLSAPGGVIRHRGRELPRRELPRAIATVAGEIATLQEKVCEHDRRCRSAHRACAARLGNGWDAYLTGLAEVLHYADHTEANLRDAQGFLGNMVRIATATRRASDADVKRVLAAAGELHTLLFQVYDRPGDLRLDSRLAARLGWVEWRAALEAFRLGVPVREKLNEWLGVIDGWVNAACGALSALRRGALEELLIAESEVARSFADGAALEAAPEPSHAPPAYPTLVPGGERGRQTRLDWWRRFQTADGILPALARLLVAGGIVGAVLGLGGAVGNTSLTVYNGLAREVRVSIGDQVMTLGPYTSRRIELAPRDAYAVQASTTNGRVIESFGGDLPRSHSTRVYNVAGASPLVEWTATYGNATPRPERPLGAPRWTATGAEVLFEEPPRQIQTKVGGGTREVLTGFGERMPDNLASMVRNDAERSQMISAHARWDGARSPNILVWLGLAARSPDFKNILAGRLRDNPGELVTVRTEEDELVPAQRADLCKEVTSRAQAAPGSADLQYLAARCLGDKTARDAAYLRGYGMFPNHGWLGYAGGHVLAEQMHWQEALAGLETARRNEPAIASFVALDIARIRRLLADTGHAELADLQGGSEPLRIMLALESGKGVDPGPMTAYAELAQGRVGRALQIAGKAPDSGPRILRLAAASDGATPEMIAQALALPPDAGIDSGSLWAAIGLDLRSKRDIATYSDMVKQVSRDDAPAMQRFLDALKAGASPAVAEKALDGVSLELRGHAYSVGVIVLGAKAPPKWRDGAKRVLFASERPYFV